MMKTCTAGKMHSCSSVYGLAASDRQVIEQPAPCKHAQVGGFSTSHVGVQTGWWVKVHTRVALHEHTCAPTHRADACWARQGPSTNCTDTHAHTHSHSAHSQTNTRPQDDAKAHPSSVMQAYCRTQMNKNTPTTQITGTSPPCPGNRAQAPLQAPAGPAGGSAWVRQAAAQRQAMQTRGC